MSERNRGETTWWELGDLCTPWCVHVAATLRVADHIEGGAASIEALAAAAGADPDALGRLMRHLAQHGMFEEPEPGRYALNAPARALLGGAPGLDLDGIGGRMAHAWGGLLTAVRTGRPAYEQVFGRPFWEDLEANPRIAAEFDRLMGVPGHGVPDPDVLPGGWDGVRTVVDVGGGNGSLLAEILRVHPDVRGTLVDLPRTVAGAADVFRAAGVEGRATTAGQSFFDPLPAGADVYVLQKVIEDWPDEHAAALLRRCAEAAAPSGRVVVAGGVSPGPLAAPELLMLVLVGGRGRSLDEFRALARGAGLEVTAQGWRAHDPHAFVVECRPVGGGRTGPAHVE